MPLKNAYLVKPYNVGKDNKSLAIVIPSSVVKHLDLDNNCYLRLKVNELNELNLKIMKKEDME